MAERPTAIKDALRETLRDLVTLHGVSGFEQPLVQYFRQRVERLADVVDVDRYGNVTATRTISRAPSRS
jgi:putative aminopeptidase FrvX